MNKFKPDNSLQINLTAVCNTGPFYIGTQKFHETQRFFIFYNFSAGFVQSAGILGCTDKYCFCRTVCIKIKGNSVISRLNNILNKIAVYIQFFQNKVDFIAVQRHISIITFFSQKICPKIIIKLT